MKRKMNRLIATALALLAPVLVLLFHGWYSDLTPDPLPVHWNASGEVDNTVDAGSFFTTLLIVSGAFAVAGVIVMWTMRAAGVARMLLSATVFAAWIALGIYAVTVMAAAKVPTAEQATVPWGLVVAMIAVPLAVAVAAWMLTPPEWLAKQRAATSSIDLAPGERVTWIGEAHSSAARWGAGIAVVVGGALMFFFPPVAIPVFVVGVVLILLAEIGVRIDGNGLHTLWGPFGWPRSTIPLTAIAAVRADRIRPAQWGGWGYRVTPGATAAVIRGGQGIVVERLSGPRYAVTVDNAEEGADVLAALLLQLQRNDP